MGVPEVLFIICIGCALVEELNARGRAVGWWGVVAAMVGLLWGSINT